MARQTEQLLRLWRDAGWTVELVPVNPEYQPRWVARVPILRAACRLPPYLWRLWRLAGRVDLMHVMANSGLSWFLFATPAVLAARLRGRSVVINYRGGEAELFLARWSRMVLPVMRLAQVCAVPSGFLREVFGRYGLETTVVPNIVDTGRFQWRAPASEVPSRPHVVVTRNLESIYDVATALAAFARLRREFPDARMTVAGSGPQLEPLRQRAAELDVLQAVEFPGRLQPDAIAALYAGADLMLNTSRVDNMPNALLEALASGVPVVSTAAGGIPWMVTDGHDALLVPVGDAEAAADAMIRILRDRDFARQLADQGRRTANDCTWDAVRDQWCRAYSRSLGGRPLPGHPA